MKDNKLVLKYCPNFYKIMNMDFQEGDNISTKLVDIYEDFIFEADLTKEENIKLVKDIDHVLNSYIEDYAFVNTIPSILQRVEGYRHFSDGSRTSSPVRRNW